MRPFCIRCFLCVLLSCFVFCGCENEEISPEVKILSSHNWTADDTTLEKINRAYWSDTCTLLETSFVFSECGNVVQYSYYEYNNGDILEVFNSLYNAIYEAIDGKWTVYDANYYTEFLTIELTDNKNVVKDLYSDSIYNFVACQKKFKISIPSTWEFVEGSSLYCDFIGAKVDFFKSGYLSITFLSNPPIYRTYQITLAGNLYCKNIEFRDILWKIHGNDSEGRDVTIVPLTKKQPLAGTYMRFKRID